MIGDSNAVISSYEKFDRCPPNKTSIDEFLKWTNQNELMHLKTNSSYYIYANEMKCGAYSSIRLDIAICNQNWLDDHNIVKLRYTSKK